MGRAPAGAAPARGPGFGPGGNGGPMGAMTRPAEKAKDFKGTLFRLARYMRPDVPKIAIVVVFAILSTLFTIVGPKIMGRATTAIFNGVLARFEAAKAHRPAPAFDFGYIGEIIVVLIVLYAISSLCAYIQQYMMAGIAQRTVYSLRRDVEDHLSRLPLKFYDGRTHGEILSRVTNDVDTIATTLQQSLTQLITSLVTIVGVIILMLTISPLLTVVVLVTLPLYVVATALVARFSQRYFAEQQRELGALNGHVEDMFTGHTIVKAFGHERISVEQFDRINERLYAAGWKAQFISGVIMPLMNWISNLGYVIIAVVGGILVTQGRIAIGDMQAFIQYSQQFTQPIIQTANIANVIQSTIACAERVFQLLDEQEEQPAAPDARTVPAASGRVDLEHVAFQYVPEQPLIEDLSLNVRSGSTIAIVGPTGAGKTTLVNLLMRFYDVVGGRITVDGTDIRDFVRGDLRRSFGMVLQDTWLFTGTIRENIAYGRAGTSEEEIVAAATAAHADHFIRTLPDGYDTILNEEASNISEGQKQLLTIARAVLADPTILILDEATSNVDSRTEVLIQRAMSRLMEGRTSFVIAHRLSTIRDAELILVMNHGTIVEQGTHRELLAMNGFYADLYNSQFTGSGAQSTAATTGV
jgi:ATP-binding cassette, subfamily B, multidrug efflux pump